MADERAQQIREQVDAARRHWQSNGFGLSKDEYAQWINDGAAAFALHRDGADHLTYLLEKNREAWDGLTEATRALAAAREKNGRLREALERVVSDEPFVPDDLFEVAKAALTREYTAVPVPPGELEITPLVVARTALIAIGHGGYTKKQSEEVAKEALAQMRLLSDIEEAKAVEREHMGSEGPWT